MARRSTAPGIKTYYETLQRIFRLQTEVLTGVLPHYGERGRNDEERLREFLSKVLPHRYGIGTGFIASSDPQMSVSKQTDIVLFDQLFNSPLYKELSGEVYPIETVYATVEVKGLLQRKDIAETLEAVSRIRSLARHKRYVEYGAVPKEPEATDKPIVGMREVYNPLPPRAYLFAYSKKGWRAPQDFQDFLAHSLEQEPEAHLHGVVVLEKNWFLFQEAYADAVTVHAFEDNSLLRFTNNLLHNIQSFPMGIASLHAYHDL